VIIIVDKAVIVSYSTTASAYGLMYCQTVYIFVLFPKCSA